MNVSTVLVLEVSVVAQDVYNTSKHASDQDKRFQLRLTSTSRYL